MEKVDLEIEEIELCHVLQKERQLRKETLILLQEQQGRNDNLQNQIGQLSKELERRELDLHKIQLDVVGLAEQVRASLESAEDLQQKNVRLEIENKDLQSTLSCLDERENRMKETIASLRSAVTRLSNDLAHSAMANIELERNNVAYKKKEEQLHALVEQHNFFFSPVVKELLFVRNEGVPNVTQFEHVDMNDKEKIQNIDENCANDLVAKLHEELMQQEAGCTELCTGLTARTACFETQLCEASHVKHMDGSACPSKRSRVLEHEASEQTGSANARNELQCALIKWSCEREERFRDAACFAKEKALFRTELITAVDAIAYTEQRTCAERQVMRSKLENLEEALQQCEKQAVVRTTLHAEECNGLASLLGEHEFSTQRMHEEWQELKVISKQKQFHASEIENVMKSAMLNAAEHAHKSATKIENLERCLIEREEAAVTEHIASSHERMVLARKLQQTEACATTELAALRTELEQQEKHAAIQHLALNEALRATEARAAETTAKLSWHITKQKLATVHALPQEHVMMSKSNLVAQKIEGEVHDCIDIALGNVKDRLNQSEARADELYAALQSSRMGEMQALEQAQVLRASLSLWREFGHEDFMTKEVPRSTGVDNNDFGSSLLGAFMTVEITFGCGMSAALTVAPWQTCSDYEAIVLDFLHENHLNPVFKDALVHYLKEVEAGTSAFPVVMKVALVDVYTNYG